MSKSIFVGLAFGILIAACGDEIIPAIEFPIDIQIEPSAAEIQLGDSIQFSAQITTEPGYPTTVGWQSSDPNIASIDSNGRAKGVAAGSVWVVAFSTAAPSVKDSARVLVRSAR